MNARKLVTIVLAAMCTLVSAGLLSTPAIASEPCPNEALRTGFDTSLPECRAYELVSPPGTAPQIEQGGGRYAASQDMYRGVRLPGKPTGVNVAASGDRLAFWSNYAPSGSVSDSQNFMASRGQDGWSTSSLVPPQSPEYTVLCNNGFAIAYSTELTSWVLGDGWGQPGSTKFPEGCGKDSPQLVEGEPQGFQNLFVSEGLNAPYRLIDVTPNNVQPADAWFQAASSNLAHVVFDEKAKLTPGAPEGDDFYVWSAGAAPAVRLVTVLPDGTPTAGALVNRDEDENNGNLEGLTGNDTFFYHGPEIYTHAVSTDASRIFFHANGNLYARENAYAEQSALEGETCTEAERACTVQIDASQTGGGGGRFMWASADGSRVFFTGTQKLTTTATAEAEKPDLYEYDFGAPEGARLTDLTVNAAEPANVQGVSGVGEDGSYVYFVADGKLTSAANSHGDNAVAGQPNLYVAHAGGVAFIATLDPEYDNMDWDVKTLTARVSPNGRFIAFDSQQQLTGYANTPPEPADCELGEFGPRPCTEIFLYDAQQKQLSCVSCDPTGAKPTAPADIGEPVGHIMDNNGLNFAYAPAYLQHNVTDQGQVFFSTAEPLTPRATNGLVNAYVYRNSELRLLTTATGNTDAYFYEASPSGNDVFLASSQPLAPGAQGSEYAIYDARVDGGFPEPGRSTACSEEDCRGALTPTPLLGAPSSQTFVGTGNAVSAPAPHKASTPGKSKKKIKRKRSKKKHGKGRAGKAGDRKARRAMRAVRRDRGGVR
jgi:hypothetical protein